MTVGLQVGERVFVPTMLLERDVQSPSAFYQTTIQAIEQRSARVDVGNAQTELVSVSKCQRNIGVLIISVGDFDSEATLIDPLSKSILQFCRILCSDDYVRSIKVRSVRELSNVWGQIHGAYSHIFVIGHGDGSALRFAVDGWVRAWDLKDAVSGANISPKIFVNLSCMLGRADYGRNFSQIPSCEAFIAPFQSIHGSIASSFAQSFLIYHLLHGETIGVAFRHARWYLPGRNSFRMWRDGRLITDA